MCIKCNERARLCLMAELKGQYVKNILCVESLMATVVKSTWMCSSDICDKATRWSIIQSEYSFRRSSHLCSLLRTFQFGPNKTVRCESSRSRWFGPNTAAFWFQSGPNWTTVQFVCSVKAWYLAIVRTFTVRDGKVNTWRSEQRGENESGLKIHKTHGWCFMFCMTLF